MIPDFKKHLYPIVLVLLAGFGTTLSGQEVLNGESAEMQQDTTTLTDQIDEITVTAFRTPYNLYNTPAPINLVTPLQLRSGSALSPVEALNQVPGIIMHHGTLNTNRLTIRGIGSRTPYATNKIKAYFGEIPLTSGDGETTLEDLENASIQRIEIVKGPSSSLYGAGLGGVILFHPNMVKKDFIRYESTAASFSTFKNTLTAGIEGDKADIYALASILTSDGYRENNETRRANMLINSSFRLSDDIELQVLLKATEMKAYIPSSLDLPTFLETPQKAAANWAGINGYEEYMKGQAGLSLNFYARSYDKLSFAAFGSFRNADELRPFNFLDESSWYLGWRGYIQKSLRTGSTELTFTSGLEMFREQYSWATISNDNPEVYLSDNLEKRSYENLFIQAEAGFNKRLYLSAGVNGNLTRFYYTDRFTLDEDQSGDRYYEPVISPRIGINYRLAGETFIFGNLSHGFSTPSFEETLLPQGQINPDIKPESGWNAEAGIRTRLSERIQATASYYRIYINNLLVARRTGEDAYIGVNAGQSLHPGLETELKWTVFDPGTLPSLVLSGNATVANYHFQEFVDEGIDYSGKQLPGTSDIIWLAAAALEPVNNLTVNLWYRHTGKMPVNDANTTFTNPYGITNMDLSYVIYTQRLTIELQSGIQNLLDVHYASMLAVNAPGFGSSLPRYYYPGYPRNYYFSLLIGL